MKKLLFMLICFSATSCMVNYPVTSFYVKNTTDKTLNFKASIVKQSSFGPFEMTLPFAVPPKDSILARQVNFHKEAQPDAWFTSFIIFPTDSLIFNDPNISSNWMKSIDAKGKPVYIFNLTK